MSTASQAETSDSDQCSIRTQITNSQANTPATDIIDPPPFYDVCDEPTGDDPTGRSSNGTAARPSFLDLSAPQGKPHFQFCSVDSDSEYPEDGVILAEAERGRLAEPSYDDDRSVMILSSDEHDNDLPSEPASMPPVLSSTSSTSTAAFSYKNPAYQSANPACGTSSDPAGAKSKATHSSDQDIPGNSERRDAPFLVARFIFAALACGKLSASRHLLLLFGPYVRGHRFWDQLTERFNLLSLCSLKRTTFEPVVRRSSSLRPISTRR